MKHIEFIYAWGIIGINPKTWSARAIPAGFEPQLVTESTAIANQDYRKGISFTSMMKEWALTEQANNLTLHIISRGADDMG